VGLLVVIWGKTKPLTGYERDSTGLVTLKMFASGASNTMRKTPAPKQRAHLTNVLPGYPLQLIAMDLLGPLPESSQKNSYVLVVSDYFTGWKEAYALLNQEAGTVVKRLVDEFFLCRSNSIQIRAGSLNQRSLKNLLTFRRYGRLGQHLIIHNQMVLWSGLIALCYQCCPRR